MVVCNVSLIPTPKEISVPNMKKITQLSGVLALAFAASASQAQSYGADIGV